MLVVPVIEVVPALTVNPEPAVRLVVVVRLPGAVIAEGRLKVSVCEAPEVVISLAVPATVTLGLGVAVPELSPVSPVKVPIEAPASKSQVAVPPEIETQA
jgi:hypothetical protein